jgi:NADH-quinone oxidoreductase subunit G
MSEAQEQVTVTIDGREVQATKGELLIKVAQDNGTFVPRFCWHERMKPVGMCRMCLVEVDGVRGLPPACTTTVTDGMVVSTQSETVKKAQDGVLEFLLINHPLDCPVCDRGGECPLQDQTLAFGPAESRYVEEKRHYEKPIPISDLVLLDRERCIQCSRCTRFADDIAGDPLIDFGERGGQMQVITYPDDPFVSYFSGNTVQVCPVGALTAKPYRFKARPWDLASVETTCQTCSVGCRGSVESSSNRIVRMLGVDVEPTNHGWLCSGSRRSTPRTASARR